MKINEDLRDYDSENEHCDCMVGIVMVGVMALFIGMAIGYWIAPYFK